MMTESDAKTKWCPLARQMVTASVDGSTNGKATPEYNAWSKMKSRCLDPRTNNYARYGGRGIKVCDSWASSFAAFLADMGPRPSNAHSLDRIDNNGHYEPSNCRWATEAEQQRNRSDTHFVEYQGRRMSVATLAELSGVNYSTLKNRLARGWSVERAAS